MSTNEWSTDEAMSASKVMTDDLNGLLVSHPVSVDNVMSWILFILTLDAKMNEVKAIVKNVGDVKYGATKKEK